MTRHARIAGVASLLLPFIGWAQEPVSAPAAAPPVEAAPSSEPEIPALVRITGVETLGDYATVGRLLSSVEGVRRVDVTESEGTTVTFRVVVRGGSPTLDRGLESSGQLTRSGASGGRVLYEFRR